MNGPDDWLARVRQLEARGELLLAYDTALQGLDAHPGHLRLGHRAVLNLAKAGATAQAAAEFQRLGLSAATDGDIAALAARIAKDRALTAAAAERPALLAQAADRYEAIYRDSGDYYPGINVATLRLLAGDTTAAVAMASEVVPLCQASGDSVEDNYYRAASLAEAELVLGHVDAAMQALENAAHQGHDLAARAATRRQLRLICRQRGIDDSVLAPLAPPTVIHYTGHMIAAAGARGRFPADEEAGVAESIKQRLSQLQVGFGYGGLACGADILFAEALLARGAELHVVLPFARDEFTGISVAPAGARWLERFEACLQRANSITFATEDRYLGHDWVFSYGSFVAMGLAILRARFLDGTVHQVAVWDGVVTGGVAGTGFDVTTWRAAGRETTIIASPGNAVATNARSPLPAPSERQLKAMLFGDVKGFSKLQEAQIPAFVTHVLGAIGSVLANYGAHLSYRNTWGDGLFLVFDDAIAAARCALDLQTAMKALDLRACGLPETLALRLGGHYGPVFEATDPVLGLTNYFGAHVSRTARIEPVTPPGEVFVTEQFAARLALAPDGYACDYVGQVPAAKNFGTLRMYHLRAH